MLCAGSWSVGHVHNVRTLVCGEIDHGTSTKVKAHPWRVKLFRLWRERLSCARFALCSHVLSTEPLACLVARCFVWYADAALKGTVHPALCGYSHGMFYVFELQKRHVQSLLTRHSSA